MEENTCNGPGCVKPVWAREMCARHYGMAWRAGGLAQLPPNESHHRLSHVDVVARTATCSICGPTKIRLRNGGRGSQCWTLRALEKAKYRSRRSGITATPEQQRSYALRRKYGITPEEYESMLDSQGGCCAICGRAPKSGRRLAVDHDHISGAVRGLLCTACNVGIGLLGDNHQSVSGAASYLSRVGPDSSKEQLPAA